jgi:hypothetical protein
MEEGKLILGIPLGWINTALKRSYNNTWRTTAHSTDLRPRHAKNEIKINTTKIMKSVGRPTLNESRDKIPPFTVILRYIWKPCERFQRPLRRTTIDSIRSRTRQEKGENSRGVE